MRQLARKGTATRTVGRGAIALASLWVGALAGACAGSVETSKPSVAKEAPPPAPADWLAPIEAQATLVIPEVSAKIPLGPIGIPLGPIGSPAPDDGLLIVVGPKGLLLNGQNVLSGRLVDGAVDLPGAEGRRIEGSRVITQLFDAAKARNPTYRFNETAPPERPAVLVVDQRTPAGLIARIERSLHFAGFRTIGPVVRGPDGQPQALTLPAPPRCPERKAPALPQVTGSHLQGSPSALVLTPTVLAGACDPESQDAVVRSLADSLAGCYARTVSRIALLQGEQDEAILSWVTAPDGSVEGVFVEAGFVSYSPDLGDCLLRTLKSARHRAPEHGRCIATLMMRYGAGEMLDRLVTAPRSGEPKHLASPLTHIEAWLPSPVLKFELSHDGPDHCPEGPAVAAQLEATGRTGLPRWLGEVVGKGEVVPLGINLRVGPKVPLSDVIAATEALYAVGGAPAVAVELRP